MPLARSSGPRLAALAAVACAAAGCVCDLEAETWDLAGASAVNCGSVTASQDPTPAVDCVLDAQSRGVALRARFDKQGIDSRVAEAFVRTVGGQSFHLSFDSAGTSTPAGSGRIVRRTCGEFRRAFDAGGVPQVTCGGAGPWTVDCR